jgi:hypothetical protein
MSLLNNSFEHQPGDVNVLPEVILKPPLVEQANTSKLSSV